MSDLYLPRKLRKKSDESFCSESEVLNLSNPVVILAEPGAGKTFLLKNLAAQLGVKSVSANEFLYANLADKQNGIVIVDGADELVSIEKVQIKELLGKVSHLQPSKFIISSRASEWLDSYTKMTADFLGANTDVFYLQPFTEDEQKQIFEDYCPNEDFSLFIEQISRFNLEPLLSNPQFLQIFARGYIESGRVFTNKKSIFDDAIANLAKELNSDKVSISCSELPLRQKILYAEEVFAKLLLAGAEGISLTDTNSNTLYPYLNSLITQSPQLASLSSTQLFRPSDNESQLNPVHKIITEYCAASYLVKKLTDETRYFSLGKCLSIIAPNAVVRDELRGLLGWMAALGNQTIQEKLIDLDPYAILANGDPSQLLPSSKKRLLQKLAELAETDPFFQRGDIWRTFNVAGFFTEDTVDELKNILTGDQQGHLLGLLLNLLEGSEIIPLITDELQHIALAKNLDNKYLKTLAIYQLLELKGHDFTAILSTFEKEDNHDALELIAFIIENRLDQINFEPIYIANFLRNCAKLYSQSEVGLDRIVGERYFIKFFISKLDKELITYLLDKLSENIECVCREKCDKYYCKDGISKIIGHLLNRYFELNNHDDYEPEKIWNWIKDLNLHQYSPTANSFVISRFQEDDNLRQGIFKLILKGIRDKEQLHEVVFGLRDSNAGLGFQSQDYLFFLNFAFENNNLALWKFFYRYHPNSYYNKEVTGEDKLLRRHIKSQARENPKFLAVWAKLERSERLSFKEDKNTWAKRRTHRDKKTERKKQKQIKKNLKSFQENKELIESGKHWGWLDYFASLTLHDPEGFEKVLIDREIAKKSLRNCISFIEPDIPSLQQLATLGCESKFSTITPILCAACLEIYREKTTLEEVSSNLLESLRVEENRYRNYKGISDEESESITEEIDRIRGCSRLGV